MKNRIMTHIVAGYPSSDDSIELLTEMQAAGVERIEVQIPFSDPIADGETIMRASDHALKAGTTPREAFRIISEAQKNGLNIPIYMMTYANIVLNFGEEYGVNSFIKTAKDHSITGLIIPDLPTDTPEGTDLLNACEQTGIELVRVLSPGMSNDRLLSLEFGSSMIYLTSTKGITGNSFEPSSDLVTFIEKIRTQSAADIALGFGIRTKADVRSALQAANIAVIGSEVIRKLDNGGIPSAIDFVSSLTED